MMTINNGDMSQMKDFLEPILNQIELDIHIYNKENIFHFYWCLQPLNNVIFDA
ncbi:MAG: hypothetical protein ACI8SA_000316 [Dokdonia sp.]